MEINLTQCVLIGLWSGLCLALMLFGMFTNRCLVLAAGVGVVLGDLPTALAMGAVGELAFLGFGVSQGGSVPPNPIGPGIIGTIMAVTMKGQGIDTASALALSFPFAVAVQFLVTAIFTAASAVTGAAQRAVERKQFNRFRFLANVTLLSFFVCGFLVGFSGAYSSQGLGRLIRLIPGWLTEGLGVAGNMLPAIGFAMILSVMMRRSYIPSAILGYLAVAYLNLPVVGIALAGAALALTEYFRRESPAREGTRRACGAGVFSRWDYRRIAFRAYYLQSAFNYGNYEGIGYAYILYPALKKFHGGGDGLRDDLKEQMEFMCTNPNLLPIITSLHMVMMENGASQKEIQNIKRALMGPLAGIGDSLVQFCLAPLFSTIGASLAQRGMLSGPVLFLLAMNGCLAALKLFSCSLGYRLGENIVESLKEKMEQISDMAGMAGVTVITGLAMSYVKIATPLCFSAVQADGQVSVLYVQEMLDILAPRLLPLLFTAGIFYLIKARGWSVYRLVLLTVAAGLILSAAGIIG